MTGNAVTQKDIFSVIIWFRYSDHECGKLQCYGDIARNFVLFGTSRQTVKYGSNGVTCRYKNNTAILSIPFLAMAIGVEPARLMNLFSTAK